MWPDCDVNSFRPEGYDLTKPDPMFARCKHCNLDGFNRLGVVALAWNGASTTTFYGAMCPQKCYNGLTYTVQQLEAMANGG